MANVSGASASEPSPVESVSPTVLEQDVRTDVGTAFSLQQADYTRSTTWVASDNDTTPRPFDRDLLTKLRSINQAVNTARVVSIMTRWSPEAGRHFVVLAQGTTPNTPHTDKFTNLAHAADLYGVFVTNHAFTKVARRIGMFVSPRTGDYYAWLVPGRSDSVIVCGHGDMYGDQKARWAFPLDVPVTRTRATDTVVKSPASPAASDTSHPDFDEYDMPPRPDCPWTKGDK